MSSYGPPNIAPSSYNHQSFGGSYKSSSSQHIPSSGLIPPSGVYGVPPGGSYAGLAIQHGSVSGNLKHWPSAGSAPTRPIQFRPPVPQGLIESIGQSVQHQDSFGIKLQQQSSIYLPPPTNEIPLPPQGLEALPLQQGTHLFTSHLDGAQALPLIQEPRFNVGSSDCGHGPSFGGSVDQQQGSIQNYNVQAGYEAATSNQHSYETQQTGYSNNNAVLSSYDSPASGLLVATNAFDTTDEHSPTSSYGPPPSGNPGDSVAYDSQVKTSSLSLSGEEQPQALPLTQEIQLSQSQEQQSAKNTINEEQHTSLLSEGENVSSLQSTNQLPGLDGAGLDIISAQQSHSLTIPVQGSLGTYQLQFQAADPLGSVSNNLDAPNHQQILSEGLLQSILSAIEQPGSNAIAVPQSTFDAVQTHNDVDSFIQSQAGQDVLAEPKIE